MDEGKLREWFAYGRGIGARYMMVILDIGAAELCPVYVFPEQNIQREVVCQIEDAETDLKIVIDLLQDCDPQIEAAVRPEVLVSSRTVN